MTNRAARLRAVGAARIPSVDAARLERPDPPLGADAAAARIRAAGAAPQEWSAGPTTWFPSHRHEHAKVLCCTSGSIVFHVDGPDRGSAELAMVAGDWLTLPAGLRHTASVGDDGVVCVEGFLPEG